MHIRAAWMAASPLLLVACGGKFADDTTGVPNEGHDAASEAEVAVFAEADVAEADAPPAPVEAGPAPGPGCSSTLLDVEQAGDVCAASESWSCGGSSYEFRCQCPQSTCECWRDGKQVKLVGGVLQCPGCVEAQGAIGLCNFPH